MTVYEYDAIRIGTLAHAFWVRVSFPEVQSLEAGRTDAVRVFIGALFKRTATTTQACAGSPTLRSGTVAFNLCVAPLMSRTGSSPAGGGQSPLAPPFEIGAPPFYVWPLGCCIHPIMYLKNVPPFWFLAPPAAKSWRRA